MGARAMPAGAVVATASAMEAATRAAAMEATPARAMAATRAMRGCGAGRWGGGGDGGRGKARRVRVHAVAHVAAVELDVLARLRTEEVDHLSAREGVPVDLHEGARVVVRAERAAADGAEGIAHCHARDEGRRWRWVRGWRRRGRRRWWRR